MSRIFGDMRQIAFVVRNIDQAMKYWSETLGVGPFFVKRELRFADYVYRGRPLPSPSVSIALANSGFMQIELIQQHDDQPSIYREFLERGHEGLQHVSSWHTRAGFDAKHAELSQRGVALAQSCTIPASGVRLAYFATDLTAGGLIYEISDLLEPDQLERIENIAQAAVHWTSEQAVIEVKK